MVKNKFICILVSGVFALILLMMAAFRFTAGSRNPEINPVTADTYGLQFDEVSQQSRLSFIHQAPVFDEKLAHIMPQVASIGAAVSVTDYDRDDWPDLYVTNSRIGTYNSLYRNQADGTFIDVAEEVGLADVNRAGSGVSMGGVWGDYDNDGFEDLFLYKWGRCELFHNEAGKSFTSVTDSAGLPAWANSNAGIWLDYDRDGYLDLFLADIIRRNTICGTYRTQRSCPKVLNMPVTAAASTCCVVWETAGLRM